MITWFFSKKWHLLCFRMKLSSDPSYISTLHFETFFSVSLNFLNIGTLVFSAIVPFHCPSPRSVFGAWRSFPEIIPTVDTRHESSNYRGDAAGICVVLARLERNITESSQLGGHSWSLCNAVDAPRFQPEDGIPIVGGVPPNEKENSLCPRGPTGRAYPLAPRQLGCLARGEDLEDICEPRTDTGEFVESTDAAA